MTEINTPTLRKLVENAEFEENATEHGDVYWYQDKWAKQSFPEKDAVAELIGSYPFISTRAEPSNQHQPVWRLRGARGACKTGCCVAGNAALWSGAEFVVVGDKDYAENTVDQANKGYAVSYEFCLTSDGRLMTIPDYADEVLGIGDVRRRMESMLGGQIYHSHNKAADVRRYAEAYAGEKL